MERQVANNFQEETEKNQLPSDFALQLVEKEMELERNCNAGLVYQIMDLYQKIIEFYDKRGDIRYLDYQHRLQKLLMRQDVLRELHYSNNQNLDDSFSDSPERRTQSANEFPSSPEEIKAANKRHKEKLAVEFNKQTQPIVKNLTRSIDQLKVRMKSTLDKTVNDFNAQDDYLMKRLASRKKMKTNDTEVQDTEQKHENYENKLESIMDNYYNQRAERIAQIRVEYETQIRELEKESDGSEIYQKSIDQLRNDMEIEIRQVIREMDARRRASIDRLHSN